MRASPQVYAESAVVLYLIIVIGFVPSFRPGTG